MTRGLSAARLLYDCLSDCGVDPPLYDLFPLKTENVTAFDLDLQTHQILVTGAYLRLDFYMIV